MRGARVFMVLFLLLVISLPAYADISAQLAEKGTANVIVRMKPVQNMRSMSAQPASQTGVRTTANLDIINGYAADVTQEGLEALLNNPNVAEVVFDEPVRAFLDVSTPLIRGALARSVQVNGVNVTGKDQTVCIVDSGVDYVHPALGGCFGAGCRIIAGYDYVNDDSNPIDDYDHGTHIAGIVASINETYEGIASGAKIAAVKVLNSAGAGSTSDVISGIEWCVNNSGAYNISIISLSLGSSILYTGVCSDSMADAANAAAKAGLYVVVASGNDASSTKLSSPACAQNVTSVGAVYDANVGGIIWSSCTDASSSTDEIACFTNSASNLDVLAPGALIMSAKNHTSDFYEIGGTSMAAPHVSAASALLLQYGRMLQSSTLGFQTIENIFKATGKNITDARNSVSLSRIDVYNTLMALPNSSTTMSNETSDNTPNFNFTAEAYLDSTMSFILWLDSVQNVTGTINNNSHYEINMTTAWDDGVYEIKFETVSSLGFSTNATSMNLTIDTNATIVSVTSPSANTSSNSTIILFNITGSPSTSSLRIYMNHTNLNYSNISSVCNSQSAYLECNYTNSSLELPEGLNNFTLIINDSVHNQANTEVNFTVDISTPTITSVVANDTYLGEGDEILLNVTASDSITSVNNLSLSSTLTLNTSELNTSGTEHNMTFTVNHTNSGIYNITLNVSDGVGNSAENNFTIYFDIESPVINITTPTNLSTTTDNDGNLTFNLTITERNITNASIKIDDVLWNYTTSNATYEYNSTNISAGNHSIEFSVYDAVGLLRSLKYNVMMNRTENLLSRSNQVAEEGSIIYVNITHYNGTEVNSSATDSNFTLNMTVNNTVENVTEAVVRSFSGQSVIWNKTDAFSLDTDASGTRALLSNSNIGSNLTRFVFFRNMTQFIPASAFSKGAYIRFYVNSSHYEDVLYFADDNATEIYNLSSCSSVPSAVTSVSSACFIATENITTLYIPHFSGGGLANDTSAPIITLSSPSNSSTVSNSFVDFNFTVGEANPNAIDFCGYNITYNGNILEQKTLQIANFTSTGTEYNFSRRFRRLVDREYNLTINCTDQKNQSRVNTYNFTVNDTENPSISSVSSSLSGTTATITWMTNEFSNSSAHQGITSSALTTTNGTNTDVLSHTIKFYNLSYSNTYYYNVTSCDVNDNCNVTGPNSFSTATTTTTTTVSTTTTTSGGTGGGGTPPGTSADADIIGESKTKMFGTIESGEEKVLDVDNDDIPVTEITFISNRSLSSVELTVAQLTDSPNTLVSMSKMVCEYFKISKENIYDSYIGSATISFTVSKSWLKSKSMAKTDIALFRYSSSIWHEIEASVIKEDSKNYHYRSTVPGFSYFAIGQRSGATGTTIAISTTTTTSVDLGISNRSILGSDAATTTTTLAPAGNTVSEKRIWPWFVLGLLVVIAIVVVLLLYVEQKRRFEL